MAQVLATPGDRRHGFSFIKYFSYSDVGRISGIAVTKLGNIIICDNLRNKLVLLDGEGNYLSYLPVEGDPWDIAINRDNVAFITVPNKSKVLVVDPDILCCRQCTEISISIRKENTSHTPIGVTSIYNSTDVLISKNNPPQIFSVNEYLSGSTLLCLANGAGSGKMYSRKVGNDTRHYFCVPGQNKISIHWNRHPHYLSLPSDSNDVKIPTMTVPSDICSDDNGHIYVSGQYSHNIHRLTEDGKVLDVPLHIGHGIKHPVAMCFNQTCTKFYIANEFGTNIQMYDVA